MSRRSARVSASTVKYTEPEEDDIIAIVKIPVKKGRRAAHVQDIVTVEEKVPIQTSTKGASKHKIEKDPVKKSAAKTKVEVGDHGSAAEEVAELTTTPKKAVSKAGKALSRRQKIKVEGPTGEVIAGSPGVSIEQDGLDTTATTKVETDSVNTEDVPKKSPGKKRTTSKAKEESELKVESGLENKSELPDEKTATPKKPSKKRKVDVEDGDPSGSTPKTKKPRKTKEEKEAEAMPVAARTTVASLQKAMHIGAHVSGAGGVHNSITNSVHIGGNAFALFLKSQRKWSSPPLAAEVRDQFHACCEEQQYDAAKHILPHGSYLVNLAQKEADKANQAYECFLDDLQRCEALGIRLYNFHPGNTGPHPRSEAIGRIAAQLNKAHQATESVVTVLENMAGSGNVIGSTFEDLRDIIALVDDKSRVGVCIDTCHSFAAGYDLRSPGAFQATMKKFSDVVGDGYLKALHMNDSKAPFESHRDLHANIGTGFLGLRAFHNIVNYPLFQDLPMVLETPIDKKGDDGKTIEDKGIWATEIKLLESLIGADPDTDEFRATEKRLWDAGESEREKFQKQADKKVQKTLDAMFKASGKTKKKKKKGGKEDSDVDESGHEDEDVDNQI